jgi:hypothetical protein
MVLTSIPDMSSHRLAYLKTSLVALGIYALNHTHSHAWVPAISTFITRRCRHV